MALLQDIIEGYKGIKQGYTTTRDWVAYTTDAMRDFDRLTPSSLDWSRVDAPVLTSRAQRVGSRLYTEQHPMRYLIAGINASQLRAKRAAINPAMAIEPAEPDNL